MMRAHRLVAIDRAVGSARVRASSLAAVEQCMKLDDVSADERKAASWAVASFLKDLGLKSPEAAGVQRASPVFARKVAALAKENLGSDEARISIKELKALSSRVLQERRINVAEAVLESLGGAPDWVEASLALVDSSENGVFNLLEITNKLHKIGFERKKMWLVFEHNSLLWASTPLDVENSIVALKKVDGGKFLMRTIFCCPLLIGRSSQEVLNGLVWELARVGADKKDLYNLFMLFQKNRESPRPVPEILERQCGFSKAEVRRRLTSNALKLASEVNHSLELAMKWFSNEGVKENDFWKMVVHRPSDFCRSTASLDEQMAFLTEWGLSRPEALQMLVKHAYSVIWNVSIAKTKIQYLVETMGFPAQTILSCPKFLSCSLGLKIRPRHRVVEFLEKQGKIERPASLQYLILSEEAFLDTYGKLHLDAGRVYAEAKGLASAGDEQLQEEEGFSQQGDEAAETETLEAVKSTQVLLQLKSLGDPTSVSVERAPNLRSSLSKLEGDHGGDLGKEIRASSKISAALERIQSDNSSPTTSDTSREVQQIKQTGGTATLAAAVATGSVEEIAVEEVAVEEKEIAAGGVASASRDPCEHANGVSANRAEAPPEVMAVEGGEASSADACFKAGRTGEGAAAAPEDLDSDESHGRSNKTGGIVAFFRKFFTGSS
ncbi:hypothetical protein SELMODRAFT_410501 [Selaginella moellendorffii]|uniref:Uncharacterized protein n=1 Tax=Selaginella moellendorffii TaxID=88036 RepID=D8REY5_SELML|nr:uncharacterized protein LOC9660073 [Selaginella moellendorffii]EFJ29521.1 hypothetical protein SELMODRAFT_410501 [Selaginella moellendorffii]|eukprot:XP_002969433.1 uncharacterized protein LOC9660073 [Selaginella moellendorffii]